MANKDKITKREYFTAIGMMMENGSVDAVHVGEREITPQAVMAFVADSLASLNRKTKVKSDEQIAKDTVLRNEILDILENSDNPDGLTTSEIVNSRLMDWLEIYGEIPSTQKTRNIIGELMADGKVINDTKGGRSRFRLA